MSEIQQRLSKESLDGLRERLQRLNGALEDSDLEKNKRIQTRPEVFDLTSKVAPTSKQKRGV